MARGAWCRFSTARGNCCITSGNSGRRRGHSNCRRVCESTSKTGFTWWIRSTSACKYFIITALGRNLGGRTEKRGGNRRDGHGGAAADGGSAATGSSADCGGHNGYAQHDGGERVVGGRTGELGMHVLSRAA